ncbi:hypothetical protein PHISP_02138 [Aspergillus sp. HF37]|nr:hypothetical protein PHISP_02138 [Aspergillus sp. HF37]
MSLRRSTRLSAVPNQALSLSTPPRSQRNGVTKPRKPSTKGKKAPKRQQSQTIPANTAIPQITEPTAGPSASSSIWDDSTSTGTSNQWPADNDTTPLPPRDASPPPLDRPVEPHRTNATLRTPHGSSLVAYPLPEDQPSPTKLKDHLPPPAAPAATTGTLLEKATAHLIATDARLKPLIDKHPCPLFSPAGLAEEIDPFRSLVNSIIGQQVSGAAAKSIRDRFVGLFNGPGGAERRFPTPEEIVDCDIAALRTAGLSQRKAEYIQGLSAKFMSGELSARMLLNASDDELVEKLTAVRGLGLWSVEMFACFALKRADVFSTGDLGVQRGCAAFMGRDVGKLKTKGGGKFKYMPEKEMLELASKFTPYRSIFMWYMWRVENVDIAVMSA